MRLPEGTGIILCSHRGPVTFRPTPGGREPLRTGPNGLVPVLLPALRDIGGSWVFAAQSDTDREVALDWPDGLPEPSLGERVTVRPLALPPDPHRQHYEVFSLEILAPLFHYLFTLPLAPHFDGDMRTAWHGYQEINRIFAASVPRGPGTDPVLVQDYHLMLVAEEIRRLRPGITAPLGYFHHVAWCEPDHFGVLPRNVRQRILGALTSFDVVSFHSRRWADAFLRCCDRFMPGSAVSSDLVTHQDRGTHVVVAPATVDRADVLAATRTAGFGDRRDRIHAMAGDRRVIGRVERADLWKNLLRGLLAIEVFLGANPEAAGEVWFPMVLSPTRTWRREHTSYVRSCQDLAARINTAFAAPGRPDPVTLFIADASGTPDRALALAVMNRSDALVAMPMFDGLNITPQEVAMVSERDPVIILSENAGIHDELSEVVLGVNPFDIEEIADAIGRAYAMTDQERRTRADLLRSRVGARTPAGWIAEQLSPVPERGRPAPADVTEAHRAR